jgi:hypothetical protein
MGLVLAPIAVTMGLVVASISVAQGCKFDRYLVPKSQR